MQIADSDQTPSIRQTPTQTFSFTKTGCYAEHMCHLPQLFQYNGITEHVFKVYVWLLYFLSYCMALFICIMCIDENSFQLYQQKQLLSGQEIMKKGNASVIDLVNDNFSQKAVLIYHFNCISKTECIVRTEKVTRGNDSKNTGTRVTNLGHDPWSP